MKFIKAVAISIISLILFVAAIRSCKQTPPITNDITTSATVDTTVVTNDISTKTWQYSAREDEMTSVKTYFAEVEAKELLNFKSPYDGGSTATLVIRNKGGANNVYLSVSKGQMLTRSYESTSYRIRFDTNPLQYYPFIGPSDGSSTLVFINNTSKFIKSLKKSKKVIIEIEFYQEGLNPIEFNVANLKWNH